MATHLHQYSTSQLLKLSFIDAIRTQAQKIHHSTPALLQYGKEIPKDVDFFEMVASGNLDYFKNIWSLTTGAGRYHIIHQRNKTNKTLLHIAAEQGDLNFVSYLVEKCSSDLNVLDDKHFTPLHCACNAGRSEVAFYLIKQGANITLKTESDCIPLFYYIRQNAESNLLIALSVISLLLPPNEDFKITNNRQQTLLHYACMNKSHAMPMTVLFLIENGVDKDAVDSGGNKCWDYLDTVYESVLAQFIQVEKSNVKPSSEIYKSFSYVSFALPEKNKYHYEGFNSSPQEIVLRYISKAYAMLETLKDVEGKEKEFDLIKKRIEKAITVLLDTGIADRPQTAIQFGHNAYNLIYDQFQFTNKTARKLLREGRLMSYKGVTAHSTVNYYYFLFNDALLLFNDEHIRAKVRGDNLPTVKMPKVFSHASLRVFSIPNGHGLEEAVQLVYTESLFDVKRKSLTLLFPSDEDKKDFITDLVNSRDYHSQFYYLTPSIKELGDVIKEGYLIKQGIVLNQYYRVYVRLTKTDLFYYDSPESLNISGRINISPLTFKVDRKKLMIRWCDQKIGRSYGFCCLNNNDFEDWQEAISGSTSSFHISRRLNSSQVSLSDLRHIVVRVTVNAGRDLAAKDFNGRSDPYCLVGLCHPVSFRYIGDRKKTPIIKKTLQPIWKSDNTFEFEPNIKGHLCGIKVECWDWDFSSNNDFMGHIILDPSLFKPNTSSESWYKLMPSKESDEEVSGDLNLTISVRVKN